MTVKLSSSLKDAADTATKSSPCLFLLEVLTDGGCTFANCSCWRMQTHGTWMTKGLFLNDVQTDFSADKNTRS